MFRKNRLSDYQLLGGWNVSPTRRLLGFKNRQTRGLLGPYVFPPEKNGEPEIGGGPKNAWKIRRDESCCRSTNPTENCPAIRHHLSTVIVEQAEVQGAVVLWGNTQEPARWVFWCFLMSLVKGRGNANVGIAWHCLLISNVWIWNTLNLQNDSTKKPYNKEH